MKKLIFAFASVALIGAAQAANEPLEYKVAVIDANRYIPTTDTSVERARVLISGVANCYRVQPQEAADMSAKASQMARERGAKFGPIDLLDWALIACDKGANKSALADALAIYVASRQSSGQTHQQAVHGLLILTYVAKTAK